MNAVTSEGIPLEMQTFAPSLLPLGLMSRTEDHEESTNFSWRNGLWSMASYGEWRLFVVLHQRPFFESTLAAASHRKRRAR